MSMGYGAAFAETIKETSLKKICPGSFAVFMEFFDADSDEDADKDGHCIISLEAFAKAAQFNDYDSLLEIGTGSMKDIDTALKQIKRAWNKLRADFKKNTEGLTLHIAFHDQGDEGSSYDDVDGVYFCVGNAYQLTPAGKKFKRHIKRAFFVQYG